MSYLLITTCTSKKRSSKSLPICASDLERGPQSVVVNSLLDHLSKATPILPAVDLYSSRSVFIMKKLLYSNNSRLFFISAGLGLISSDTIVPNYNITASQGNDKSSIKSVINGSFSPTKWWEGINPAQYNPLSNLINVAKEERILLALSKSYLDLIRDDIERICDNALPKVRFFGIKNSPIKKINKYILPYDSRLNGPKSPIPGTMADFPQRCIMHYCNNIQHEEIEKERNSVQQIMQGLPYPNRPKRITLSDDEVHKKIRKRITEKNYTKSSLLRFFRDSLNIACEQNRFFRAFDRIKEEMSRENT